MVTTKATTGATSHKNTNKSNPAIVLVICSDLCWSLRVVDELLSWWPVTAKVDKDVCASVPT